MKRRIRKAPKPPDSFTSKRSAEVIRNLNIKYGKVLKNLAKRDKK